MLELRFGTVDPSWIQSTRPALLSLQTMAMQVEHQELCAAIAAFCGSAERLVDGHTALTEATKAELLGCYQRLIDLNPQAFELDAERDRREPVIVEALLRQVDGVERLTLDKLFAAGLNRVELLIAASVEDVVAVSGIPIDLAGAILRSVRAYKAQKSATVAVRDPMNERREIAELVTTLTEQTAELDQLSTGWGGAVQGRKRELRRRREQTFQQIRVALARLGDRERLTQLEKLPFEGRITMLGRFLAAGRQT